MDIEKKRKLYIILSVVFSSLLFVWICVAAYLSGDGNLGIGAGGDRRVFYGLLAAELPTLLACFFCANRAGKLNVATGRVPPTKKLDPSEKRQRRRTTLLFLCGAVLSYAMMLIGIVSLRQAAENWQAVLLCLGLLLLCAVLNPLATLARMRQIERRQCEEGDSAYHVTRHSAAQVAEDKLRLLKKLRTATLFYAAGLLFLSLTGSFWLGSIHDISSVISLWWPFGFFAGAATVRIPFPPIWKGFQDMGSTLKSADYPELWSLCKRAATAVGCPDSLRICAVGNSEVSVSGQGNECLVSLGIAALLILTEDELYQLLLRAFAPSANRRERQETRYVCWLQNGRDMHALAPLCALVFRLPDKEYAFQYQIYRYAASFCEWEAGDQIMLHLAEPKAAASALLRLRYYDLWRWEQENRDRPARDTYAQLLQYLREEQPEAFRCALPERRPFWDSLIEKEYLSENWAGKTLREQLKSFGDSAPVLLPYAVSPTYRDELLRAAEKVDSDDRREEYEAEQCAAQKTLDEWEAAGRPLRPQDYGGILVSLDTRGRLSEALALCDRAINELPDGASIDYPCFFKGRKLLHDWDARGLNLLYRAMEGNGNYIEGGLNMIASYCRLSGNREALRQFEERAPELSRRHEEEDSEIGVLRPTDDLSAECLPEDLKENILKEILTIDHGEIRQIFLVHKRITPTRSTSAMVVQFESNIPSKREKEIMRKIFNVLDDSTNWQFSLFEYEEVRPVGVERIEGSLFYVHPETQ